MKRRAFIGALAALVAAPVAAIGTRFVPLMVKASDCCWRTPCGETITAIREIAGRVFVFTARSTYELKMA